MSGTTPRLGEPGAHPLQLAVEVTWLLFLGRPTPPPASCHLHTLFWLSGAWSPLETGSVGQPRQQHPGLDQSSMPEFRSGMVERLLQRQAWPLSVSASVLPQLKTGEENPPPP